MRKRGRDSKETIYRMAQGESGDDHRPEPRPPLTEALLDSLRILAACTSS